MRSGPDSLDRRRERDAGGGREQRTARSARLIPGSSSRPRATHALLQRWYECASAPVRPCSSFRLSPFWSTITTK